MKDMDKYVEEKAKELPWNASTETLKDFIRIIVEDCQPKVSRIELSDLASEILGSITTSRVVGLIEVFLKTKDIKVEE